MKVSHKVALLASSIVLIAFALFSWIQYNTVRNALYEKTEQSTHEATGALGLQVTNWLNGKLVLIDMMSEIMNENLNSSTIQQTFDTPLLIPMDSALQMTLHGIQIIGMPENARGIPSQKIISGRC
jgi:methyl-accepting chemotaxis protein